MSEMAGRGSCMLEMEKIDVTAPFPFQWQVQTSQGVEQDDPKVSSSSRQNELPSEFSGGPLARLYRLCHHISPRLVEVAAEMERDGASKGFVKRFKREGYSVPLGIVKGILAMGIDPLRAFRELEEAKFSVRIASDLLKSTRVRLDAPQEKVATLLEELLMVDDLIDVVIREYRAPVAMRLW